MLYNWFVQIVLDNNLQDKLYMTELLLLRFGIDLLSMMHTHLYLLHQS